MKHRAREVVARAVPAVALALAACAVVTAVAGCASATAAAPASATRATATSGNPSGAGASGAGASGAGASGAGASGAGASGAGASGAGASGAAASRAAAPVYGPPAPDPACVAAERAKLTLESRQGKDQYNETALDRDFTNFAAALTADAQREKRPAAAQAMTALANDYTDLVESQSGAAQLPNMSQVQKDGAAFDKACTP